MIRILFLFSLLIFTSCTYHELSPCENNEPTFSDCVKPIFEQNCMGCHSMGNPDGIMALTNYQEIQEQVINGNVIESLKREEGFMPKSMERLGEEEILIIENWKENGAPNN
jgi:hypothetical protein